ncbi:predicted protein [Naegleria gruberi]|uniref:Predicted protein n=1 Tax=Naegleria gruberi TaxID=5762 RepID=D2VUB1_NAEGR|nr:uncharacterized protein NAEGRDRAFT_72598 [Naegleria gruberi]EFC39660.1 predicted protein [Naegleria gruberi]|eukprot:XP_002672404.1 predicted protein [Naegleria gruberi strain NEG-M]
MGTSSSKPSKAMKSSNITENTALYIKIENDSSSNKSSKKNKNSTKVPKTSDDTSKSTKASKKAQVTSTEHDLYSIKLDASSSGDAEYSNHIDHLAGPILFSAPHGLQVYRGGAISKKEESVHAKEIYTNEICLLLSLHVKKYLGIEGSFIMWNPKTAKAKDKSNLDPNYLVEKQFMSSPFHLFLLKMKNQYSGFPTLHVDLHGKANAKNDRNLDIGTKPMEVLWKDLKGFQHFKKDLCDNIQLAVSTCNRTYSGMKLTIDSEPHLHGYWGENTVTTISHQSVMLGMPALQIEIPMEVRKDMISNEALLDELAKAIVETYKKSVLQLFNKDWEQVETKISNVMKELSSDDQVKKHNPTHFDEMASQMIREFALIEKKQKAKKQ